MDRRPDISALLPDEDTVRARREALTAELRSKRRPGRTRFTVRKLVVAATALVVLSGGVAWATGVFSADDVSLEAGVGCYSQPRLHGGNVGVTITHASADPIAKCRKYWREGVVDVRRGPASPHLVACTGKNAGVAVFPGPDSLCEQLGLVPLPADYAPAGREAGRAYTAWFKELMSKVRVEPGECRSPRQLAHVVRSRLAKTEYRDVEVVIESGGPCAESVEARGRQIEVLTGSRAANEQHSIELRASSAMQPLLKAAVKTCRLPKEFAADARKALAEAGLSKVRVRVERKDEPCLAGGTYGYGKGVMIFAGSSRKEWKRNRSSITRHLRARAKYERSRTSR